MRVLLPAGARPGDEMIACDPYGARIAEFDEESETYTLLLPDGKRVYFVSEGEIARGEGG